MTTSGYDDVPGVRWRSACKKKADSGGTSNWKRTTDLRRATALPGFIGHSEENRLSCGHRCAGVCARGICHACPASEKGPIRSSLCVPMMPSLQRGPAKSILTPSQIDGPSSRVCLGLAALTYVPTPHDSPIHISLLSSPFSTPLSIC